MPSESGFLEMAPIDRLRDILGRGQDDEARRLTGMLLDDGKQAWVTRRPNKTEKSLIEIDPRKTKFRKNEGFFIAWEFPVDL